MGVLDDAIREHLDLKKRRGASDEEIARAEAEALTPARRPPPDLKELEEDDAAAPEPTVAVHDIDEDPMPAPAHGHDPDRGGETVESDPLDIPTPDDGDRDPGRLSE